MSKAVPSISLRRESIDQLATGCLLIPFFSNDRPFRDWAGWADWRLNGKLSEQLVRNRITGEASEIVLMPTSHRLPAENVLLVGLGPREKFTPEVFSEACSKAYGVLQKAKVQNFVMALTREASAEEQVQGISDFLLSASKGKERPSQWTLAISSISGDVPGEKLKKRLQGKLRFENLQGADASA